MFQFLALTNSIVPPIRIRQSPFAEVRRSSPSHLCRSSHHPRGKKFFQNPSHASVFCSHNLSKCAFSAVNKEALIIHSSTYYFMNFLSIYPPIFFTKGSTILKAPSSTHTTSTNGCFQFLQHVSLKTWSTCELKSP